MASVTPFVQVGTYPTRNFATLGPFYGYTNTHICRVRGVLHCASLLYVATQFGLSHLSERRAWRLVSEDSGARLRRHRPAFPADCPHLVDFHCSKRCEYQKDSRSFQHMARFIYVTTTSSPRFLLRICSIRRLLVVL